jgi:hypothetical protein
MIRRWAARALRWWIWPCPATARIIRHDHCRRHRQQDDISAEIDARPRHAAPDESWAAEALLRSAAPRLYAAFDAYWRDRWRDWYIWQFRQDEARNRFRLECGLAPLETPTLPMYGIAA